MCHAKPCSYKRATDDRIRSACVAAIDRDIVEAPAITNGTLYVGLENIQSGGDIINVRPVDTGELASSKFAFSPKHLLYGKLRPYLAKIARPNFHGICSTDILPVLRGPKLDRNFLAHFLLTPEKVAGEAVFNKARVINTLGNRAVHGHRPIPAEDAKLLP